MSKFHINKHGVPAPCRAKKGNCPLGGADSHFDSIQDAQKEADRRNEAQSGLLPETSDYGVAKREFNDHFHSDEGRAELNTSETFDNPEIRKYLERRFGEDAFVVEVKDENEDPLQYALYDTNSKVEPYYNVLRETNESNFLYKKDEGDWSPRFKSSLQTHLKENQGPVEDVYGKKMRKTLSPEEGAEFARNYVEFNDEFYSSRAGLNTSETFDNPRIKAHLESKFGKDAFVVEKFREDEDPLEYSLYDNDRKIEPYYEALESTNDNQHVWHEPSADWDGEFKEKLRNHLKKNEGEDIETYGITMRKALDPHEGANFIKSYIKSKE